MKRKNKIEREEEAANLKMLSDGQKWMEFTKSEGWGLAKRKLMAKLATLDSISTLPDDMPIDRKLHEISVRAGVVSIIWEWIKDVEGAAAQARHVSEAMSQVREEAFVVTYGGEERSE